MGIATVVVLWRDVRPQPLEMNPPKLVWQAADDAQLVAFSPDGRTVITSSADRAQLKELKSGVILANLEGHSARINDLVVDSSASLALTGSADKAARLWDTSRSLLLHTLEHGTAVTAVALSPEGDRLVTGCSDGSVHLWSVEGQELATFADHLRSVTALEFNPSTANFASASLDGSISVRKPTGEQVNRLKAYRQDVQSLAFSREGKSLAVGTRSGQVLIFPTGGSAPSHSLHFDPYIDSISFTASGEGVLCSSALTGRSECKKIDGSNLFVLERAYGALISPLGDLIVATTNSALTTWDANTGEKLSQVRYQPKLSTVEFTQDGRRIVASTDEQVLIWDLARGNLLQTVEDPPGKSLDVADPLGVSRDGSQLALFGGSEVKLADVPSGKVLSSRRVGRYISEAKFTADGERLAVVEQDGVHFLSTPALEPLPESIEGTVFQGFAVRDDVVAAVDRVSDEIRIYRPNSKRPHTIALKNFFGPDTQVLSPDGRYLAGRFAYTGQAELQKKLVLYDLDAGVRVWDLPVKRMSDLDCRFSPDGSLLIISEFLKWFQSIDSSSSLVLDVETLEQRCRFPAVNVKASHDSSLLAATSSKGVEIREARDGSLKRILRLDRRPADYDFSPDGKMLAVALPWSIELFEVGTGAKLATLMVLHQDEGWVVVTPEGLFDGSEEGVRRMAWRIDGQFFTLEQFKNIFESPDLLARIFRGERPRPEFPDQLYSPPNLRVESPKTEICEQAQVELVVVAEDRGGGYANLTLNLNGETVEGRHRGQRGTFPLVLEPGKNRVRINATDRTGLLKAMEKELTLILPR